MKNCKNSKFKILLIILYILMFHNLCYAKSKAKSQTNGFAKDNYGISFYCSDDSYYNDGWHLIDDSSGQKHYFYKRDNEAFFRHCECGEEPETQVAICKDTTTNKVWAYNLQQISAENSMFMAGLTPTPKLVPLTEFFSSHMLSTKGCYFNERKYDTLWRYTR